MSTKIEWTDGGETWNFLVGCDKVSTGCANCYAIETANIRKSSPNEKISRKFAGTVKKDNGKLNWTGQINFDEATLLKPLSWKCPRKIFVNSLSDLFHENVKDEWIDKAFAVMALCPQHTFQILTKRAERMRDYLNKLRPVDLDWETVNFPHRPEAPEATLPLPNVWLGCSVENQKAADERIPLLLETPAAVRWLSCEPLLGEVDLSKFLMYCTRHKLPENPMDCLGAAHDGTEWRKLDWVVVGGESGANARPMHPDWARSLRDQCKAAGVPFFFKQWGEFVSVSEVEGKGDHHYFPDGATVRRVGKKNAGRTLDGQIHNEFPNVSTRAAKT